MKLYFRTSGRSYRCNSSRSELVSPPVEESSFAVFVPARVYR